MKMCNNIKNKKMKQLIKKIKITTTIELLTGLHIGGNSENVEIGGIDSPVIKVATKKNQPYIPGSSLRGKMRCLLEQIKGTSEIGGNPEVNNLFGCSEKKENKEKKEPKRESQPSKLIVRDAYLCKDSIIMLETCDNLDMPYTESKWENVIDRVKGTAEHPRQIERIPAGVKFSAEFIINVWDEEEDGEKLTALLEQGIRVIENDYLGGSGSRGYGQVKFGELKKEDIRFDNKTK
jgi:CRISPR-associated protein Csm3